VILLRQLHNLPTEVRRGAVAIGNFDGVHQGHARIVERLKALASQVAGPAVVFTFDPHPIQILRPERAPPPLTQIERKAKLLGDLGVDAVIACPTDRAILDLTAGEFFDEVIVRDLAARALVEGPNFGFGRKRGGDIRLLEELCNGRGIALEIAEPLRVGEDYISSSRVRALIQAGQVVDAAKLLTRPYRSQGIVVSGERRGSTLGFPTANLADVRTLLPAIGVYAGRALVADRSFAAAVNVGPNPTFGEQAFKIEAHLIGFSGSLYGRTIEVEWLERLRDTRPFPSVEALKEQLCQDIAAARKIAEQKTT
jgi:riboflavin kinase/FMN adenylyltransferase